MEKDTPTKIIQAARVVFARLGYKKTSLADIAEEARISRTSIYHYFSDKLELFEAVLVMEFAEIRERTAEAISLEVEPAEKLRAYVRTRMETIVELGNFYSAMRDEYLDHLERIERFRKDALEEEIETLRSILDQGVSRGVFSVRDTTLAAVGICMALKGFEFPMLAFRKSATNEEEKLDSLLEILFWGIRAR